MKVYNVRIGLPMPNYKFVKSFTRYDQAVNFYNSYHPDYPKELNEADTLKSTKKILMEVTK